MAHVHHHHAARSPVIAQWHEHNLAQLADNLVATVINYVYVTADADPASTAQIDSQTSFLSSLADATASAVPSSTTIPVYNAPSRQVRPDQTTQGASTTPESSSQSSPASSSSSATQTALTSFISSVSSSAVVPSTEAAISSSLNAAAPTTTSASVVGDSTQPVGMSGGAKAGLSIGILAVIALMAAFVVVFVRGKKRHGPNEHQRLDDEKNNMREKRSSIASRVSVHHSQTSAPRLSLRPLTQMFMPGAGQQDINATILHASGPVPNGHEPSNPFGDPIPEAGPIAAPAATAVLSSTVSDRPRSDGSDSASLSAGQAFPTVVAGSRRNSPPGPGPNNVHRVQLDFKPSMEDELELRAGSLVRMLHEYDDGWALCIRLDRSQQGVVPRTCISKLPVKPRAGPPPSVRGALPRAPSGASVARQSVTGQAANHVQSQTTTPGQQTRSHSPTAQDFQAEIPSSNSDANSPTLDASLRHGAQASTPIRKPVPGQAV